MTRKFVDDPVARAARKRSLRAIRNRRFRRRLQANKRLAKRLARRSEKLPSIVAEVFTYEDLLAAIKKRRHELRLTQEQVDEIAGFHERYTSKLEMGPGKRDPFNAYVARDAAITRKKERKNRRNPHTKVGKALGEMSLPTLLQALRCKLVMVALDEGEE